MKTFISLLSGGLDSPIAAYLMTERNFKPIFLSFLTSDDNEYTMKKKVSQVVKKFKELLKDEIRVYFIVHDPNLNKLKKNCDRKLTCILCKRIMLRIAIKIAKNNNTNIIVTGDILGEQASQTLDNLISYNDILENFILIRPIIGWDKIEVINLSKKLGLYDISSQKSASCQFNPKYPETHGKIHEIQNAEKNLNIQGIITESLGRCQLLEF